MCTECISQGDLCAILNRSWGYVNNRMNGQGEWSLADVYKICDTLKIPYSDIMIFFPMKVCMAQIIKKKAEKIVATILLNKR